VCIKIVPRFILASLSAEDVKLLCLSARLKPKQISFVLGLPLSSVYRRLNKLQRLGLGEPCIYIPMEAVDGAFQLLKRPLLILTEKHCVYIPEVCETECLKCPYYSIHLNALTSLGLVDGHYATPQDWADALVERVKKEVKKGFRLF